MKKNPFSFFSTWRSRIGLGLALTFLMLPMLNPSTVFAQDNQSVRITPTVRAVAKVLPSVVNLSTEKLVERDLTEWDVEDPFEMFFKKTTPKFKNETSHSLGSGTIIDPSGIIVTNTHVVHRAFKIKVRLADGREFYAREIASADLNDIALLQLIDSPKEESLHPITFAQIDDLFLGETVIAVGNPYGLGSSITRGVLSAIGRQVTHDGNIVLSNILQTDAPINPGNSGGPLININGNMIGVNIAMFKNGRGISFAIPLERVENLVGKWLTPERFGNYSLGLVPAVRKNNKGAVEFYLRDVIKGSPAWKKGLRAGDVFTEFNGRKYEKLMDISRLLWKKKAGDEVSITLANGKKYNLAVEKIALSDGKILARIRLGLGLQKLSPSLSEALGYPFGRGIVVSDVLGNYKNLHRGDMLVRIGDIPIYSFADIARALHNTKYGDKVEAIVISVINKQGAYYLIKKTIQLTVN